MVLPRNSDEEEGSNGVEDDEKDQEEPKSRQRRRLKCAFEKKQVDVCNGKRPLAQTSTLIYDPHPIFIVKRGTRLVGQQCL